MGVFTFRVAKPPAQDMRRVDEGQTTDSRVPPVMVLRHDGQSSVNGGSGSVAKTQEHAIMWGLGSRVWGLEKSRIPRPETRDSRPNAELLLRNLPDGG